MPEAIQDDQTKRTWDIYDDGSGKVKLIHDTEEGNVNKQEVQDNNGEALLTAILKELKKIHLQLELMNDTKIENSEVE